MSLRFCKKNYWFACR